MIQEVRTLVENKTDKEIKRFFVGDNNSFLKGYNDVVRDAFNDTKVYLLEASALTPFPNARSEVIQSFKFFGKTFNVSKRVYKIRRNKLMHPIKDENRKLIGDYVGNCIACFLVTPIEMDEFGTYLSLWLFYKAKKLTKKDVETILNELSKPKVYKIFTGYLNKCRADALRQNARNIREYNDTISRLQSDIDRRNELILEYKKQSEEIKAKKPFKEQDIKKEFSKLKRLSFVKKLELINDKLIIHLGRLTIRSTENNRKLYQTFGDYKIIFRFSQDQWRYTVLNSLLENQRFNQHPHVSTSGNVCEGRLNPYEYMTEGKISIVVQYLYELLSGYNSSSPYVKMSLFKRYEKYIHEKALNKQTVDRSMSDFEDEERFDVDEDDDDDE